MADSSPLVPALVGGGVLLLGLYGLATGAGAGALVVVLVGAVVTTVALIRARKGEAAPEAAPPVPDKEPPVSPIPFEELRARHAKPAVALVRPYPPHRAPVGRSRLGGLPDLPPDVPWPRGPDPESGEDLPLHFLAQIHLDELPWRPEGFPETGTLLFFARVDETMDWDGGEPVRVVYDPTSAGVPTEPPEDVPPIEGGHNDFDRTFRAEGEPFRTVYPAWPLVPKAVETMPDGDAFVLNSWFQPAYADYHAALEQLRADQLGDVAEASPRSFPIFAVRERDRVALAPHAETGFPWAAETIGLVARALCKGPVAPAAREAMVRWRARAETLAAPSPEEARAFVGDLDAALAAAESPHMRRWMADAIERGVRQVLVHTGGDPALAACIPDAIYAAGRRDHAPIVRAQGRADEPWARDHHQRVQHHQMFGYVPASQHPLPVRASLVCLLQLRSDLGANLMLCDLGEADFLIEAADLEALRFDEVTGQTSGG